MESAIYYLSLFFLIYFAFVWLGYTLFLLVTPFEVIRKHQEAEMNSIIDSLNDDPWLPVSVIIPMHNETHRIINAITALQNSQYKNVHFILVNDGSTDNTLELLIKTYSLSKIPPAFQLKLETGKVRAYYKSNTIPNFIVVDKEHSPFAKSGADCINAGLNVCRTPVYLTVDADTILEPEALSRILFTYLTHPHCVAVGGNLYVVDPHRIKKGKLLKTKIAANPTIGVQVTEYLRSFLYGREGWDILGGVLCFPGAFSLLETEAVLDAGGYDAANFAYDAEITIKLHHYMRKNKYPYAVVYASSAIAWTEVPGSLKALWRQRSYWQRGMLRSAMRHKLMMFNPKYGKIGLLAFPCYILLEILGPVVESLAYITFILALCFSFISFSTWLWFIALAVGYMMVITMSCVILSLLTYNKFYRFMDIVRIFLLTLLDMVFYRQIKAFCVFFSTITYMINRLRGKPQ